MLYPIKFKPIYKEKVWGGQSLKKCLNKDIVENSLIGESWEVCAHPSGTSIIDNGALQGKSIIDLLKENREEVFGKISLSWEEQFPLLIKFIDAKDKLSVQVHPDDDYAKKYEKELGKTEMWYIVDAVSDAYLIYGLSEGAKKDEFITSIKENTIENILKKVSVKKGDVLFIPSGSIHAIGEGIVLAEIQQNSDTTYRVYDWNRLGLDGKPRQLHVKQAIAVTDFENYMKEPIVKGLQIKKQGYTRTIYVCCKYFTTESLDIHTQYSDKIDGERFEIYMCIDGAFKMIYGEDKVEQFSKGETIFMPANIGSFQMKGEGKIIRTYIMNPLEMIQNLKDMGYIYEDICNISGLNQYKLDERGWRNKR
ncbi:type I phosphomannose isomerase catalytic subunit [Anaerophilus nitritogenes]|uniref:type I phosphomannose isomerase catalytic subunit n=1 Tax=Anaerophilus nitritogenes TaxID=2498136 RepID=UPI00101DCDDC|nr:type I phosphomannose isomerase catalytic subunit [Anaerophilus nitritogenes]